VTGNGESRAREGPGSLSFGSPARSAPPHPTLRGDGVPTVTLAGDAGPQRYPLTLLPQHQELLAASAITPEVARRRGYVSADSKAQLGRYDFAGYQQRAPGLLIPLRRADGSVWGYQYRPDTPRQTKAGATVKYETPAGQRNGIDVPPHAAGALADPAVPLLVTEGTRKADAAVSHGLMCVALAGVWGWRGSNGHRGKLAVADWHDVALNGRRVILAFDSDVTRKPAVRKALAELANYLASKGVKAEYLHLPELGDGKCGLDDYIKAEGTEGIWELVRPELPALNNAALSTPRAVPSHLHTPPVWASGQDILARLVRDAGVWCGFTGEHRNAKLTYLAITSRILDDPVSIAVKGLSSSGKSYTISTMLRFFPDEAVITMTAMSERALIYMKDDFARRTLVLFEAVALREEREKTESNLTAYIVRSLLSEGEIRYPVAMRGPDGKMVTETITKKGPTNFIVTTTAASLHGENETRMLSLPTDDSAEQTRAIMASIAAGQRGEADFSEWHAYARWIAAGNRKVVVPYAAWLAGQIPPVAVRLRRDFRALLRLIETHAIMHQLSRATDHQGRIVATEADYLAVRELVADLISNAVGQAVSATVRETAGAVAELDAGEGVTVHHLAEHLGLERSTVQYRVTAAREKGYLVNAEDRRGRAARWRPGSPLPDDVVILPERIEGVNSHPDPLHTPPADAAPQASVGVDGGCEGVKQPRGDDRAVVADDIGSSQPGPCTRCGEVTHRYGDGGSPLCPTCQALAAQEAQP
jgi:hypothetical protein